MNFLTVTKKINSGEFSRKITGVFSVGSMGIRIVLLVFILGYCFYLWYGYVYNPKWDEGRRKEYMNTKEQAAVLDKKRLNFVIEKIENRKKNYASDITQAPNIFRLDLASESPR